jgi:hypothetical protein
MDIPDQTIVEWRRGDPTPGLTLLDLAPVRNSAASTWPDITDTAGLDGLGRSLPAEELIGLAPLFGEPVARFGRGGADNLACEGQSIGLRRALVLTGWSVVGACLDGSMQDTFVLVDGAGGEFPVEVGLTDFYGQRAAFDDVEELRFSHLHVNGRSVTTARPRLWRARSRFDEPVVCRAVVVPLNPGMHVFAIVVDGSPLHGDRVLC